MTEVFQIMRLGNRRVLRRCVRTETAPVACAVSDTETESLVCHEPTSPHGNLGICEPVRKTAEIDNKTFYKRNSAITRQPWTSWKRNRRTPWRYGRASFRMMAPVLADAESEGRIFWYDMAEEVFKSMDAEFEEEEEVY